MLRESLAIKVFVNTASPELLFSDQLELEGIGERMGIFGRIAGHGRELGIPYVEVYGPLRNPGNLRGRDIVYRVRQGFPTEPFLIGRVGIIDEIREGRFPDHSTKGPIYHIRIDS